MDRSVDHGGGKGPPPDAVPIDDGAPVDDGGSVDDSGPADDGGSEDIETELYSSTREAGVGAVSFGPVEDG